MSTCFIFAHTLLFCHGFAYHITEVTESFWIVARRLERNCTPLRFAQSLFILNVSSTLNEMVLSGKESLAFGDGVIFVHSSFYNARFYCVMYLVHGCQILNVEKSLSLSKKFISIA